MRKFTQNLSIAAIMFLLLSAAAAYADSNTLTFALANTASVVGSRLIAGSMVGQQCVVTENEPPTVVTCPLPALTDANLITSPTDTDPNHFDAAASDPGYAAGPIDVYGYCRYVDNSSTQSIFVPFRTEQEWVAFVYHEGNMNALCARPGVIPIAPDTRCNDPNATFSVIAPYARLNTTLTTGGSFACVVPGQCNSCGCGPDQPWTETVSATIIASNPSVDGNTGPEVPPDWTVQSVTYGGDEPPANAPPACTPPPQTFQTPPGCTAGSFGSACNAVTVNPGGAVGNVYNLTPINAPDGYQGLAGSMSLMTAQDRIPNLTLFLGTVDVPLQSFTQGFPMLPDLTVWFGICLNGTWTAPEAGAYTFVSAVDDAAALWVDGNFVAENDGGTINSTIIAENLDENFSNRPVIMRTINVTAGQHQVHIMYYQGWPVQLELQMWAIPPGQAYTSGTTPSNADFLTLSAPGPDPIACP
jgi:hypothetical protein